MANENDLNPNKWDRKQPSTTDNPPAYQPPQYTPPSVHQDGQYNQQQQPPPAYSTLPPPYTPSPVYLQRQGIVVTNPQPIVYTTAPSPVSYIQPHSQPYGHHVVIQPAPVVYVHQQTPTQAPSSSTYIVHEQRIPDLTTLPTLGKSPVSCICPSCNVRIATNVTTQKGICSLLLTLFGIPLIPAVVGIPFIIVGQCSTAVQDHVHSCPNCRTYLGTCKIL